MFEEVIRTDQVVINTFKDSDPALSKLIELIGNIELTLKSNYFESLVFSIVSQMLSAKVAETLKKRLLDLVSGDVTPDKLLSFEINELRKSGISPQKASYILGLSQKVSLGQLDLEKLKILSDEDAIKTLTSVKGIGRWTAEMFLIFSLGRKDVISLGDVGLQRSALWLYRQFNPEEMNNCLERHSLSWIPYRSFASLYLWRAIDDGYVDREFIIK
ncbi:DNA-3-methyladenine glycosylase family protein [Paenibacillus sp. TC-CSREp1]|uniref:DNA-3-methyladenine glycosylase family protein n=1 Tax=Paenibacillus sp. TC-CSREp1 TaxID=3410089 RepID=UPI003CFC2A6D